MWTLLELTGLSNTVPRESLETWLPQESLFSVPCDPVTAKGEEKGTFSKDTPSWRASDPKIKKLNSKAVSKQQG